MLRGGGLRYTGRRDRRLDEPGLPDHHRRSAIIVMVAWPVVGESTRHRSVALNLRRRELAPNIEPEETIVLKRKILAALLASAFSTVSYAQALPASPATPATPAQPGTAPAQRATPATPAQPAAHEPKTERKKTQTETKAGKSKKETKAKKKKKAKKPKSEG